jgi:hypothetical protein
MSATQHHYQLVSTTLGDELTVGFPLAEGKMIRERGLQVPSAVKDRAIIRVGCEQTPGLRIVVSQTPSIPHTVLTKINYKFIILLKNILLLYLPIY